MDNSLQILTSKEAAKDQGNTLCHFLAKGGFEVRQWASNDPSLIEHVNSEASCELWLSRHRLDVQESALGLQSL